MSEFIPIISNLRLRREANNIFSFPLSEVEQNEKSATENDKKSDVIEKSSKSSAF